MGRDRKWAAVMWAAAVFVIFYGGIRVAVVVDQGDELNPWSLVGLAAFSLMLAVFGWYLWDRDDRDRKE